MIIGIDGSNANVPPDPSMSAVAHPAVNAAEDSARNSAPDSARSSASNAASDTQRVIHSRVLGEVAVSSDHVFTFPEGLHGFAQHTDYALVPAARDGFWWLQATDEPELAFLLADPFAVAPGYEVDISAGDEQFLGLASPGEALVLTVVTLPASKGEPATTNLRGPLVFNAATQRARQVVSAVDRHSLHAPIDLTGTATSDALRNDVTGAE